ncbi:tuftelin isoform X10 [Myotis lucifugus]|uniref:tuftelin isoform X10 n=1 Tax=Myotis lucifugus TaxID=59463 RepID=UPI000CCC7EE3|nr:tuftelin isoform X10 [Myotis lucifugus]
MKDQVWGWKEWQLMLLPLLIYDLSNLVKSPKGQGQLFVAGSCLYSLGCQARTCTFSSLLRGVSLRFLHPPYKARVFPPKVVLERPNGFSQSPTTLYSRPSEVDTYMNEDVESLRKTVRDLLAKLQEAEQQHQADRVAFEVTLSRYQREAEQSHAALQRAEDRAEQKEVEIRELQRRLLGMETEHQASLEKAREGEAALEELRSKNADCRAEQEKAANLEKEVAGLREKIHHLDDMLKSQQRKVRQMIEQLQNSKAVIQSKDTSIQELKEKMAYLEAENLEMHDRMEHLIEKQVSHANFSTQTWAKTENLGSVRIAKPPSPKPMPLIRVVET